MDKKYLGFDRNFNLNKVSPIKRNLKRKLDGDDKIALAKYSNIGYYLVTPLLFGVFLGLYTERLTGKKVAFFVFLILGVLGTFYNLFKLIKS